MFEVKTLFRSVLVINLVIFLFACQNRSEACLFGETPKTVSEALARRSSLVHTYVNYASHHGKTANNEKLLESPIGSVLVEKINVESRTYEAIIIKNDDNRATRCDSNDLEDFFNELSMHADANIYLITKKIDGGFTIQSCF